MLQHILKESFTLFAKEIGDIVGDKLIEIRKEMQSSAVSCDAVATVAREAINCSESTKRKNLGRKARRRRAKDKYILGFNEKI